MTDTIHDTPGIGKRQDGQCDGAERLQSTGTGYQVAMAAVKFSLIVIGGTAGLTWIVHMIMVSTR
jgi:hypothetical protein